MDRLFCRVFILLVLAVPAWGGAAAEFTDPKQCVVGRGVTDRKGRTGTVTSVDGTLCRWKLADGTSHTSLFWMLRPAGGAPQAAASELAVGTYRCFSSAGGATNYLFMDVRILGPARYSDKNGTAGRYRLEKSGRIVFESGPFSTMTAKLFPGPKIGLNTTGGSFFSTTCDLVR